MTSANDAGTIGHNSALRQVEKDRLKSFLDRIERCEEEKAAIAADIRDLYTEAKAHGFDTKALRAIVRLRKQDADKRREQEAILETYMHALGMLADTPLGQSAVARALESPPPATLPDADTSNPPFNATDDVLGPFRREQPATT